jgi:hypothetical protein
MSNNTTPQPNKSEKLEIEPPLSKNPSPSQGLRNINLSSDSDHDVSIKPSSDTNELRVKVSEIIRYNGFNLSNDEAIESLINLFAQKQAEVLQPFKDAINNKGSHPEYHDAQVAHLKEHWPVLYKLITNPTSEV